MSDHLSASGSHTWVDDNSRIASMAMNDMRVNHTASEDALRRAQQDLHRISQDASSGVVVPGDSIWPEELDDLNDTPEALYFNCSGGYLQLLDVFESLRGSTAAVVGTREISDYGAHVTTELVKELIDLGQNIISGGAYGVDAAAHRAALAHPQAQSTPTVAVLAGGLDNLYPAGNSKLFERIAAEGALLSEYSPSERTSRQRFLQRNRIIAALSQTTLVTEAGRYSGSLNTARHAQRLGRRLFAVPGPAFSLGSTGPHDLIRTGQAALATSADDIL